jgi:hypothetical protein
VRTNARCHKIEICPAQFLALIFMMPGQFKVLKSNKNIVFADFSGYLNVHASSGDK